MSLNYIDDEMFHLAEKTVCFIRQFGVVIKNSTPIRGQDLSVSFSTSLNSSKLNKNPPFLKEKWDFLCFCFPIRYKKCKRQPHKICSPPPLGKARCTRIVAILTITYIQIHSFVKYSQLLIVFDCLY